MYLPSHLKLNKNFHKFYNDHINVCAGHTHSISENLVSTLNLFTELFSSVDTDCMVPNFVVKSLNL